jgi:hypothetical protein
VSEWQTDLEGNHRDATWQHVITQSAGFDYPYGEYPAFKPGEMWTYSDLNLVHFCHAMGKVYGKALARGRWKGQQLVPRWFVEELETKQTQGMLVNYEGPNDGMCHL